MSAPGRRRATEAADADKLERESLEFHERVRMAFRGLAEAAPGRYLVLDAMRPASELAPEILATVDGLLASRRPRSFDPRRSVAPPGKPPRDTEPARIVDTAANPGLDEDPA